MKPVLTLSPFRIRLLAIIAGLAFMAALGFKATPLQLMMVMLLPVGIGVLLTFMRWPSIGLIVAVAGGVLIPFLGPSGLSVTMVVLALLLGLWFFDMLVSSGQIRLAPSRILSPLLAFLMVAALAFGIGQLPWLTFAIHAPLGAQLAGLSIIVLSMGALLLVANQVRDLRWLSRLTWAFLAVASLSVLVRSVLPELGLPTRDWFPQVGTVFYICLVSIAFSQALFNEDLPRGWRWALGGLILITVYILFFLKFDDKGGWISVFVSMIVMIGARSWRVGLALVVAGFLAVILMWTRLVGADQYSISTRFDAWSIMAQIIRISPLFGLGFANYYWYTPLFPIRGYAVSFNSHNNYIDILAQMGVVGLLCFVWLLLTVAWLSWQLRDKVPAGFARAYVYGAMGILAGMFIAGMLGDWILPFFYNIGLNGFRASVLGWLFLGGLVSLEQMVAASKTRDAIDAPLQPSQKT